MDLTNNTYTTTGCRYVQAREQKLSKLYLKQKKKYFFLIYYMYPIKYKYFAVITK